MSDRSRLGAVVLAGALQVAPAAALILEVLRRVPARFRHVRGVRAPLDLDSDAFRYRVSDDRIRPVRRRVGAIICRDSHPRH